MVTGPSTRIDIECSEKKYVYLSETVLFLFEKSNFCLNFSKLSVEKFFLKVIFFNSIRIGTTSLSCFAFKVIENVPAGRAVFFSLSHGLFNII